MMFLILFQLGICKVVVYISIGLVYIRPAWPHSNEIMLPISAFRWRIEWTKKKTHKKLFVSIVYIAGSFQVHIITLYYVICITFCCMYLICITMACSAGLCNYECGRKYNRKWFTKHKDMIERCIIFIKIITCKWIYTIA